MAKPIVLDPTDIDLSSGWLFPPFENCGKARKNSGSVEGMAI